MTSTKSGGMDGVKSERFVYSSGLKMNELQGQRESFSSKPRKSTEINQSWTGYLKKNPSQHIPVHRDITGSECPTAQWVQGLPFTSSQRRWVVCIEHPKVWEKQRCQHRASRKHRKHDESAEHHGKGCAHHKPKLEFQMHLTDINALLGSMKS